MRTTHKHMSQPKILQRLTNELVDFERSRADRAQRLQFLKSLQERHAQLVTDVAAARAQFETWKTAFGQKIDPERDHEAFSQACYVGALLDETMLPVMAREWIAGNADRIKARVRLLSVQPAEDVLARFEHENRDDLVELGLVDQKSPGVASASATLGGP